jgi:4-hydroxythreonine-4-phosphate dehydrogenase
MTQLPPLALTMGDPAGVGGELTLRAWLALRGAGPVFLTLDDPGRLGALAAALGLDVPIAVIDRPEDAAAAFPAALPVLPTPLAEPAVPGQPRKANAAAVVHAIAEATRLAMAGAVGAVVTNPINKAALYDAGFTHPGHTEFLAALTGVPGQEVMMLASPALRVVPVTIHMPLREAIDSLTAEAIVAATRTTDAALRRDFGIARPRLAIAGLNPHAGEQGALGDEEARIVIPAIETLRRDGLDVSGPWPPDTLFTRLARPRYDVAICLYHDQALIPLKTLDMDHGVNVTLGLPIIRTSPDHGTAYDIAGKGVATPTSLIAAIELAGRLAQTRSIADRRG